MKTKPMIALDQFHLINKKPQKQASQLRKAIDLLMLMLMQLLLKLIRINSKRSPRTVTMRIMRIMRIQSTEIGEVFWRLHFLAPDPLILNRSFLLHSQILQNSSRLKISSRHLIKKILRRRKPRNKRVMSIRAIKIKQLLTRMSCKANQMTKLMRMS